MTPSQSQTSLYWQTSGSGPDIVLLHGWGMNGAVWQQTAEQLAQHFTVHVVDLPGYGNSAHCHTSQTDESDLHTVVEQVLIDAPDSATWVGWSLGGLVATHAALHFPQRVQRLVTVASSPKFAADKPWRGIQPKVLDAFTEQLMDDFSVTVERFMALQAMGSPSARQDVKALKLAVFSRPEPNRDALYSGLKMLADVDLRMTLGDITQPMLRLYGRLDGLVPLKVSKDLDAMLPHTTQFVFNDSSHAPFMTELESFCQKIIEFERIHNPQ